MQSLNLSTHSTVLPCPVSAWSSARVARNRRQSTVTVRAAAAVADNSTAVNNGLEFQINDVFPPAEPEPVSEEVQAIINEQGLDYEASGLKFLTNDARVRCQSRCWRNMPLPGVDVLQACREARVYSLFWYRCFIVWHCESQ